MDDSWMFLFLLSFFLLNFTTPPGHLRKVRWLPFPIAGLEIRRCAQRPGSHFQGATGGMAAGLIGGRPH